MPIRHNHVDPYGACGTGEPLSNEVEGSALTGPGFPLNVKMG